MLQLFAWKNLARAKICNIFLTEMFFSSYNKLKSLASRSSSKAKFAKSGSLLLLGGLAATSILGTTVYAYGDESDKKVAITTKAPVSNNLESVRTGELTILFFIFIFLTQWILL